MPITYPYNSGRLTIAGTINSVQTWSINIGYTLTVTPDNADLATWLPTLDTALTTWWSTTSGIGSCNPSYVKMLSSRSEFYVAGSSVPAATANHSFGGGMAGTTSGIYNPAQTSLVVSLLTAASGRHNRGRLYLPILAAALASGPIVQTANVDAIATSTATLLHAINISTLAASAPQVIVRGQGAFSGHPVTSVQVDNEPDIQRRRADKLVASYFKSATV